MLMTSSIRLFFRGGVAAAFCLACLSYNDVVPRACGQISDSAGVYEVGVAKKDITPDYPVRLSGFAFRKTESEGVSQQVWTRALAIGSDDQSPVVIVTLDNLGVRLAQVNEVAKRLADKVGLKRDHLIVTFTHTHCAPKVNGAADNIFAEAIPPEHQVHLDRYTTELIDAVEAVVLQALADRKPATLEWGVGEVGFAKNRRQAGGPVDHSLPVLIVRNRDEQKTVRAVYASYACHCVTLSHNLISGDWAGYAAEAVERQFPDSIGLISIGCGSDQNPIGGVTGDKVDIAQMQGMQIGDEVARLVRERKLNALSGTVCTTLNHIQLSFQDLPSRSDYEDMVKAGRQHGYNASTQLAKLDKGESLPATLEYPIQTVSFGKDLCMVFLAGEVCVDYAIRLRHELAANKIWMHGYSNDFGAYIPSERLLAEGGYGAGAEIPYFALPTMLKTGLEQQIVDEVHRQVPEAFHVARGTNGVAARTPKESIESMTTHPELKIELAASEPQVVDPVAIDFGPDGRVWVCQMVDYGHGIEEEFEPRGEIRVLSDTNADGQYEGSVVFLDKLRYPTDVKVWRDGAIICDAPDIIYAEDTDDDGKADVRTVLFTGFATHNGQARVNSLQWGLDNWLYGSCGLFGGVIINERGETVDVTGRDFRMQPDTGRIEPVTGQTQQSRVRDDWGNWFGCSNGTLIRHYPVNDEYAKRNPFVAPPATAVFVPAGHDAGLLFPSSDLVLFKLSGAAGRATSACGVGIYRDNLLGDDYAGNSFTCEPVNQLIYRQVLNRQGATIRGRRAGNEQNSDFLTSTDRWFRPVQVRKGLYAGLWVVDMYRYVIEHPKWIPEETLADLNVFAGQGMGRIYRVGSSTRPLRKVPNLVAMNDVELAAAMNTENGTVRDLVHQVLIWREATEAAERLIQVASSSSIPAARLQALCALDGLDCLSESVLMAALSDVHSEVRRHAVRLSELRLKDSPALATRVLRLAEDSAFEVRLQVASSLANLPENTAVDTLLKLVTESSDAYLTSAVLSSLNDQNVASFVECVMSDDALRNRLGNDVLASAAGLGSESSLRKILADLVKRERGWQSWQFSSLAHLLDGLDRRKPVMTAVVDEAMRAEVAGMSSSISDIISDPESSDELIQSVLALVGRRQGPVTKELFPEAAKKVSAIGSEQLIEMVSPQFSATRQQSAIQAIAQRADEDGAKLMLSRITSSTPQVRQEIVKSLLGQRRWDNDTVAALEDGILSGRDFDAASIEQFVSRLDGLQQSKVADLLKSGANSDRRKLVEEWADVATMNGAPLSGRAVFGKRCSVCHRLDNVGHVVGPDLAALTTRSTGFLLHAILDPNRDVDARYQGYIAVNDEGRSIAGMLVSETATSITLREQEAKDHVLLRNRLEELRATGKSAMPEGLEKDLTKQDLANIIAYLQELGPIPRKFAGNSPQLLRPSNSGQIELPAANAAIFGGDIIYETESPFRNIGYWHSADDYVAWSFMIEDSGEYEVWLDYSCDDTTAGNLLRLEGGDPVTTIVIGGTGGWNKYRQVCLGSLHFAAGRNQLIARAADRLRGSALLDLRTIVLAPVGAVPSFSMVKRSVAGKESKSKGGPMSPSEIARALLDESQPREEREKLIAEYPQHSAAIIAAMSQDLPDDETEEYRRIPWIWRVAIAAGKRNESGELLAVLDASLPQPKQSLRDWQAVVIGGGIINGISLSGDWPLDRLQRLIAGNAPLTIRWQQSMTQASVMTDDVSVRNGTRYDAMRMIALCTWAESGEQLVRYLARGVENELQQGAISGLSDMPAAEAGRQVLLNLSHYSPRNQSLAIEAMLRTLPRIERLLTAMESGDVATSLLSDEQVDRIRLHEDQKVNSRAAKLFGEKE